MMPERRPGVFKSLSYISRPSKRYPHVMDHGRRPRTTESVIPLAPNSEADLPEMHQSNILAGNVHCTTCVNHIRSALQEIGPDVQDVSIRLNEVSIKHRANVTLDALAKIIRGEGYDVYRGNTVDKDGQTIAESNFDDEAGSSIPAALPSRDGDGALRSFSDWFRPKSSHVLPTDDEIRERHFENCAECRAALDAHTAEAHPPSPGASSPKPRSTPSTASSAGSVPRLASNASDDTVVLKSQRWKTTISIDGMTCASCSNNVTATVKRFPSVREVQIDVMSNSGFFIYEGSQDEANRIVKEISETGYESTIVEQTELASVAQPSLYRAKLGIKGMTCASCSSAVTKGLKELDFVKKADIVLLTHSGEVVFENKSNIDKILEKIDDLGYDVSVDDISPESESEEEEGPKRRTVQVKIDGMHCDRCPPMVIKALKARFGSDVVVKKEPTFQSPIVTVVYEPEQPERTIRDVLATIERAQKNFSASIYHPPSVEERSKKIQIHERNSILRRLIIAFICAIPTFILGIVFMMLLPEDDPLKIYFMEPAWAGQVPRGEWAMLILATVVYFFSADVFHLRALKEIRALWRPGSRVPILRRFYRFGSMNLLISAGTTVAYFASIAVLIVEATGQKGAETNSSYFDSVVFLTFFILAGRLLEAFSKSKTSDAVSMLGELRPAKAMLVVPEGTGVSSANSDNGRYTQPTKTQNIDAELLEIGDLVIVAHGSSPPADGVITQGEGKFDESSLTGESRPVTKTVDEEVFVGTVNSGNPITMRVTGVGGGSMLDQIVAVVREGLSKRAPVERLADVLTGYFVPIITLLAILTFIIWASLGYSGAISGRYVEGQPGGWAFYSLGFAISVFVAACPCGIGLAAPTALFVGIGLAAKHGILVRGGGQAFQEAPNVDAVVFDKTGTLTEGGDLKVTSHERLGAEDAEVVYAIASRLEEQSSHPIAQAIVAFCSAKGQAKVTVQDLSEEPGRGLRGTFTYNDVTYEAAIGSQAYMQILNGEMLRSGSFAVQMLEKWQNQAQSVAILALRREVEGDQGKWNAAALFGTSDPIRPSAVGTIADLQSQGIGVYMLSGDNATTARAVATSIGIPVDHVFAGVLPTEKASKISQLQRELTPRNKRGDFFSASSSQGMERPSTAMSTVEVPESTAEPHARIAFVGDGINDAPALMASDVSISLSTGSAIALTASSFVLLSPSLTRIPLLLRLSKRVMRRVKLNYGWALVYNVILVPVAAGVLFRTEEDGFVLGPVWAALAMAGSSVSVVLSSLALRWEGKQAKEE